MINFPKEETVSWAITVCNEHDELNRLLNQLIPALKEDDEIVVQGDQGNVTEQVVSVLHKYRKNPQVKYVEYPLNRDFATFKNNLFKQCTKKWIFQVDADETLAPELLDNLKSILFHNRDIEMFRVPRINIVNGLTQEWISKWGWKVNNRGWVNFPDDQSRLFRNTGKIAFQNKVHEQLVGYESWTPLPSEPEFALIHVKEIDRQIRQNQFYDTI